MQISMFTVSVRFVSDGKGPLEAKPKRTVVTLAGNHLEALQKARTRFIEVESAGVAVEYGFPSQCADTIVIESPVLS